MWNRKKQYSIFVEKIDIDTEKNYTNIKNLTFPLEKNSFIFGSCAIGQGAVAA